jgi:Protein kinase domain
VSTDLTRTSPAAFTSAAPSQSRANGRFVAGTVLANRYRIVSLLGVGGMGEVYKAEDLKLDQPVALKFLPETLAMSPSALARFHGEARIARQVSHPNVCRVHDIGDVDGLQFLTMEFIDGEDLASLLRRIGRLPADKALEIARQLCTGLAAAHDAGVLHRDLKPHNVMIDGRGRARITDFGVAAIAREVRQDHAIAGTPAYMAPEQFRGGHVTVRSDVYALGLVLYELFTGRRAIPASSLADAERHHASGSSVTTPSDLVRDLDPNVERVIMRCLESDPALRPASAIQVAAALPGGDPLQAALAAGETPSPEMVAAAGSHDAMRPAAALPLAVATIAVIVFVALVARQFTVVGRMAGDASPEVLAFRAREMLAALGYPDRGRDRAAGFERDLAYLDWDRANRPPNGRMERLAIGRPAALQFWYRESPEPLFALIGLDPSGPPVIPPLSLENPPASRRGMRHLRLDMKGRLIEFGAVPLETEDTTLPAKEMDWNLLFSAAGLDRQRFQPVTPSWTPPAASDDRAAWTGVFPEQPDLPIRLEAAAYRGRLVWFRSLGPWSATPRPRPGANLIGSITISSILLISAILAWFNARTGRVDRRGAVHLVVLSFSLAVGTWIIGAHYVVAWEALQQAQHAVSQALMSAALGGISYLAVEPHVRRRWPAVLVAWSRVFSGRWRDPLVGRDVLVGLALGAAAGLVAVGTLWLGSRTMDADSNLITSVLSTRTTLAALMTMPIAALAFSLILTVLMLVLRTVARSNLLAVALVMLLGVASTAQGGAGNMLTAAALALLSTTCLIRFGLVALFAFFLVGSVFAVLRAALAWNSGAGALILGAIVALTLGAAYMAMGSPRLPRAQRAATT